jgi:hypothetical protein
MDKLTTTAIMRLSVKTLNEAGFSGSCTTLAVSGVCCKKVPYISARKSTEDRFIASEVSLSGVSSDRYVSVGTNMRGCMAGSVSSRRK